MEGREGGVTQDIQRVKPKNVPNERDRKRKKRESKSSEPINSHCQIYNHTKPRVDCGKDLSKGITGFVRAVIGKESP